MALPLIKAPSFGATPQRPPLNWKQLVFFGAIGVIVVLLAFLGFALLSGNSRQEFSIVIAKLQAMNKVISTSQKRIRSGELAKINSDASLLFTTDNVALLSELKSTYAQSDVDKSVLDAQTDTKLNTELDNAVLLDRFDVTYRNRLREKIAVLQTSIDTLQPKLGRKDLKDALSKLTEDLNSIDSELDKLNL